MHVLLYATQHRGLMCPHEHLYKHIKAPISNFRPSSCCPYVLFTLAQVRSLLHASFGKGTVLVWLGLRGCLVCVATDNTCTWWSCLFGVPEMDFV